MQNKHIAHTIRELCKTKDITITTLLADCGLSKSFIYELEKRDKSPSCEKISKIADYLNVSVDYILGRTSIDVNNNSILLSYDNLSSEGKLNLQNYIEFLLYNEEKNKVDSGIAKNSSILEIASAPKEYKEFKVYDLQASAGLGKYFGEEPVYTLELLEVTPINYKADQVISIKGDSMQPTICDGSYVFIEEQPKIENGEVGIFILNDEVFCKRLILEDNKAVLRSDNNKYPDIVLAPSDVVITIGKVLLANKKY